jgi:hypothetical protein
LDRADSVSKHGEVVPQSLPDALFQRHRRLGLDNKLTGEGLR